MRERKFRVWSNELNMMFDSDNLVFTYKNGEIINVNSTLVNLTAPLSNYVLEEYMGKKDEFGIEVYDNDVVELDLNNLGIKRCIVKWHDHNASWYFDNPKQNYFMEDIAYIQEHIKVVGNIHTIKA